MNGAAQILKETISPAGFRVTLAIETNRYRGAQAYYAITRHPRSAKSHDAGQQRFVPVVYGVMDERRPTPEDQRRAEAAKRAEEIFEAFAKDATDGA